MAKSKQKEQKKQSKREHDNQSDIEQAKKKAAKIREQGLQKYKELLLQELESDKKKKLAVVSLLYFLSLMLVVVVYYSNTDFDEVQKAILYLFKD